MTCASSCHSVACHENEFGGPVYPVNPAASVVQCVPAYASVEDVPGPVDLAVIAVPAARVLQVAEECGRKDVRALVVLSAGFAETGPEGRARQAALLRVLPEAGSGETTEVVPAPSEA